MFYNVKNEKIRWQLMAFFLLLYLCWLLNRSLNHSCIAHTTSYVTKCTVHFCCLFQCKDTQRLQSSLPPSVSLWGSTLLWFYLTAGQLCGVGVDCYCALLFPCHFVSLVSCFTQLISITLIHDLHLEMICSPKASQSLWLRNMLHLCL